MANNRLNFTISIRDRMSPTLRKIQTTVTKIKDIISRTSSFSFNGFRNSLNGVRTSFSRVREQIIANRKESKKFSEVAGNGMDQLKSKIKGLLAAASVGLIIKASFKGAAQLEQYRNTLETILKDRDSARRKLAWGAGLANRTPFGTEEVVGGMVKLQSYGIEGDRVLKTTGKTYMEMIGDMASAMGKSFDQAVEAVADARTGELERLKEFGITKQMIGDFGKNNGFKDFFNNKGQITNMQEFNRALFEMMNSRYGGSMEKQAKTWKGAVSTIQGVFQNALANMAGVNMFGDLVKNSPFAILKDKVLIPLSDKMVELSQNGTITKWSENIANSMEKIIDTGKKLFNFIVKWKDVLIPLTKGLLIAKIALSAFSAIMSANPISLGLGAIIVAGTLLYKNWDKIKAKFGELTAYIGKKVDKLKGFFKRNEGLINLLTPIKVGIQGATAFYKAWDKNKSLGENLKNGFKAAFSTLKKEAGKTFNYLKNTKIGKGITKQIDNLKNKFKKNEGFFNVLVPAKPAIQSIYSFYKAWDKNKGLGENLKSGFKASFDSLKKEAGKTVDYLKNTKIGKEITKQIDNLKNKLKGNEGLFNILVPSKTIIESVNSFFKAWDSNKSVFENLKNGGTAALDVLKNQMEVTREYIKNTSLGQWFIEKINKTKDSFNQAIDLIKTKITNTTNSIRTSFESVVNNIKGYWESLKNSIMSVIDTIVEYINNIKNKIGNPFSAIGDTLKGLPGVSLFFKDENPQVDGSHADGLNYVPYDGYIAELHKGERVLTKEENRNINKGGSHISINLTVNGNSSGTDWEKIANFIVGKIKEHEDEKLIMEGEM